ncbi:UTP-hexose-1-phosphate uridylyltransferase /UDP-glucose-hexose-1-phosphate uridylyltransferase [Maridesulfovibrio ferrireducens]|uniref:Galactose-1-phosphate uridylyltransferase n=1 Tax=Maridesulfovibrio ferrireducens TaxID=246191 RepID=A0A1G9KS72_9BACT|nr:UDP-glucose--hexose-1-phosphate uridylyltransferase [Maridesulfovibrio ferrireducens]SDL52337.1 UTP-hexose-1-phosphate uridylyltransferase /UDP-glucose-hexose-1-phosphate uridylyltransferase [Maridesulfovibrio ferrireducens]
MINKLQDLPHKRFNPLTGEWVLVSPHRTKRPWQGRQESTQTNILPSYDPKCYLCPGNVRNQGATNPDYKDVFVFDNDFPSLLEESVNESCDQDELFQVEPESGVCRVVCFSPRHDLTLSRMTPDAVRKVVDIWCDQFTELSARKDIGYVQIFENRGDIMGCSNPHPHCQVWATRSVPTIPANEDIRQEKYLREKDQCLLCRYVERELKSGERVVFENDSFVALVPFWAVWPFETMLLPKAHMGAITDMNDSQKKDLADSLVRMGIRFDNLFETSFPYSMGIHQRPARENGGDHWHWHIHYYPPLLRSATVRKFMVGFELMGMPQRDITAEQSAKRLRDLPEIHFQDRDE